MQPLQPTLWRTCRVLANRQRLRLLKLLFQRPNQCVSDVARQSGLAVAVASQYLRALNARGLLEVTRSGRWVRYRPSTESADKRNAKLIRTLRGVFNQERDAVEKIFRLTTAFTHPRRIELYRAIQGGSRTPEELRQALHVSPPTLARHLRKLQSRGLVSVADGRCGAVLSREPLSRALVELANMH